jgi:DNA-binding transcriptional ArsR family regulator
MRISDPGLQELARFARVLSHPARLAILKYLAETRTCISGDISDSIPLSRSTVSQHLKELRDIGLIRGDIDGLKINYCLCGSSIKKFQAIMTEFFDALDCDNGEYSKMKILILCTGNSCRSQMAHGFLQSFDKRLIVRSAGTEPAKQVNQKAVKVMQEVGIDISHHTSWLLAEWHGIM